MFLNQKLVTRGGVILAAVILVGCGTNDRRKRELDLREREIARKEKELALRESNPVTNVPSEQKSTTPDVADQKDKQAIKLTTFSKLPSFIVGCCTVLAESKDQFGRRKYIFADDTGAQCLIQVDGKPIVLKGVVPKDPTVTSEYTDGDITVSVKILNTHPSQKESQIVEGELVARRKDGAKATVKFYGEQGC